METWAGMPADVLLAVLSVYLLAGMVKGAMGFGLPIVSVSILPFVVPVGTALGLNALVLIATNLQQIRQGGACRDGFVAAWPVMAGMLVGVPVGAALAADLAPDTLILVLGIFILIFVALSVVNPAFRVAPAWRRKVGVTAGAVSGVVGALTSAPASIFVMFMVSLRLARPVYMTALGTIMGLFGTAAALSYAVTGVLTAQHVLPALASIPPAVLGMWLGDRWASRLGALAFRRAVLVLLAVLAVLMIRRSLS